MGISFEKLETIGFDMNRLEELVQLFESRQEVFSLIEEMYVEGSLVALQKLIDDENFSEALLKSHYLKGVALGVGAKAIADAATALESKLREHQEYSTELEQIRVAWNALAQVIEV